MAFIAINNVNFHYERWGEGAPPVVFVSGYTCNIDLWRTVAETVAKQRHQVLIFDNQGMGETKDAGGVLTAENMANNICDFIAALGLVKPVLVGYAMGSTVAQAMAIQNPTAFGGLVLLSTVMKWSDETKEKIAKLARLKYGPDKKAYYVYLREIAFGPSYNGQNPIEEFIKSCEKMPPTQTKTDEYRQINVLNTFDSSKDAGKITVPTLILTPEYEELAPLENAQLLADNIGNNATLVTISNAGHAAIAEQPEAVKTEILRFLDGLRPAV